MLVFARVGEGNVPIQAHRRRAVVALGGNAITRSGEEGTVEQDYANLERSLECVIDLYSAGYEVVLTHGNGPQIGNQMIRVELARGEAPVLPLDLLLLWLQQDRHEARRAVDSLPGCAEARDRARHRTHRARTAGKPPALRRRHADFHAR